MDVNEFNNDNNQNVFSDVNHNMMSSSFESCDYDMNQCGVDNPFTCDNSTYTNCIPEIIQQPCVNCSEPVYYGYQPENTYGVYYNQSPPNSLGDSSSPDSSLNDSYGTGRNLGDGYIVELQSFDIQNEPSPHKAA